MICEKCGQDMETILCGHCGEAIIRLGPFCYACGRAIDVDLPDDRGRTEEDDIDLSERILCSDGACIGVVENGVCKLCGKPYAPESGS